MKIEIGPARKKELVLAKDWAITVTENLFSARCDSEHEDPLGFRQEILHFCCGSSPGSGRGFDFHTILPAGACYLILFVG